MLGNKDDRPGRAVWFDSVAHKLLVRVAGRIGDFFEWPQR
jgi:hypothetical protein